MDLEKLKKQIDSLDMTDYINKIKKEQRIAKYHVDKLSRYGSDFINKVITKYDSDEYINRWCKRGIEPPEKLKFILLRVAEKYGIETEGTTPFTFSAYLYKGFRFEQLIGQGSAVNIYKLNN